MPAVRALLMVCCVALAGCRVSGAVEPRTSPKAVGPVRLSTAWTVPGPFDPSVVAADVIGVVAVGALGDVRAYYPNGQERWSVAALDGPVYWRPALSVHAVVVSLGDRIVALDRATGSARWQHLLADPGRLAIGTGSDGIETVVVTGADSVVAYRVDTGGLRWGSRFTPPGRVAASVSLRDGRAVVAVPGATQSSLEAFDLASGRQLWEQPIALQASEPAVTTGEVVVAESLADGSRVRALDLATGATKWTLPVSGLFLPGFEAAIDDHSYAVTADNGDVLLVDLASHSVLWTVPAGRQHANVITTMLVGEQVLVTADGHGLVSIVRRSGRVRGRDPDREVLRSVTPDARSVYVLSGVGTSGILRRRDL